MKTNIKHKIRALLSKTVNNGATEAEAISAMIKAQELMKQHYIEEHELSQIDEIVVVKLPYNSLMIYILYNLGQLFNCKTWFVTKEHMYFYGYETDTKLASYFYDFILKTVKTSYNQYTKSLEYNDLVLIDKLSKRTIKNNFSKGFLNGIYLKISKIYEQRNNQFTTSKEGSQDHSLMIITGKKLQNIYQQFLKDFPNLTIKSKIDRTTIPKDVESFKQGLLLAEDVDLTIPLGNNPNNNEILMLE